MVWKYEEGTLSYTESQSYAVSHKKEKEEGCVVKTSF